MTITELDLDAIAPGTAITAANTGNFFDLGYPSTPAWLVAAEVSAGVIGARPRTAGAANAAKNLAGKEDEGRIGYKIKFLSVGAATSYFENVMLRTGNVSGGTILADVGLRNASGTREMAFRNNFAYVAQANGNPMLANETWTVEIYWLARAVTVYIWDSTDSSGTPTYTWGAATVAGDIGNMLMFNDSADTVDAIFYDIWLSDGERREVAPIPGTLNWIGTWDARDTLLQVVGKVTDAEAVSVTLNGNPYITSLDADGYFRCTMGGLTADTTYTWAVLVDGVERDTDTIKTLPAANATSGTLRLILGSCYDSFGSPVFAKMAAKNPDLQLMPGDKGYTWLSSSPNGPISPTVPSEIRTLREPVFAAVNTRRNMDYRVPQWHMYSDCDGAGANSDSTIGGHANGSVNQVWRQMTANLELPIAGCGARATVIGKIRLVFTDELSFASAKGATDDASKTKLGATQKAWFFDQIDAAAANKELLVWIGDGPIGMAKVTSGTSNEWSRYFTELTEIDAKVVSSGVRILRVNGDRHAVGLDNGTNHRAGIPTINAAPIHTTAQPLGLTSSNGNYPPTGTTINGAQQYAVIDLSWDAEGGISMETTCYTSSNTEPTEVPRLTMSGDFSYDVAPTPPYIVYWDGSTRTPVELVEWDGTSMTPVRLMEKS